ncbi:PspA/IM30 family protein [Streptacidiphilus sp. P02-A3a]|nr:PspA/IM30 family protein [Streptacidiphilus sp. P02-A3a]QMU70005.1 PspA/IM30 family protein [Streptacidiphilus sp. P02-A3a]
MTVTRRLAALFTVKANKALDRAEDPRELLDRSYRKQLELAQQVRRGVADVATSRKRVESQRTGLRQSAGKLEQQAQRALLTGREDLAREALGREALGRRGALRAQDGDLEGQAASLGAEEEQLTLASHRLQARIDAFRSRKETIKASCTAAEAETRINESVSGISEEMGDVGPAVQRAQDRTEQLRARAPALEEHPAPPAAASDTAQEATS